MTSCRECGKKILPKQWKWILCILDEPEFCSRKCAEKYIERKQTGVNAYILDIMMTKTREE